MTERGIQAILNELLEKQDSPSCDNREPVSNIRSSILALEKHESPNVSIELGIQILFSWQFEKQCSPNDRN
jgi:hypothetical protein